MTPVAVFTAEQLEELLERAAERGAARALAGAGGGDVLTTAQAAKLAGVTRKTVNTWISGGRLPAGRRGDGKGRRAIRREDLDRFLAGERAPTVRGADIVRGVG